jgi:hypothetical protein
MENIFSERDMDAIMTMTVMLVSYIGYRYNAHRIRQSNDYIFRHSKYGYLACVIVASLLYWIGGTA